MNGKLTSILRSTSTSLPDNNIVNLSLFATKSNPLFLSTVTRLQAIGMDAKLLHI